MVRRIRRRVAALAALPLVLSLTCHAADERKQLAFEVIDRNAEQMALVSDPLFFLGELGMQELVLGKARAEFLDESKKTPCFTLLPPDVQPPVELNRAEMEKYRPQMRKFYLNRSPRFN